MNITHQLLKTNVGILSKLEILGKALLFVVLGLILCTADAQADKFGRTFKKIGGKTKDALKKVGEELDLDELRDIYDIDGLSEWEDSIDFLEGLSTSEYNRVTRTISKTKDIANAKLKYVEAISDDALKFYTDQGSFVLSTIDADSIGATLGDYARDMDEMAKYAGATQDALEVLGDGTVDAFNEVENAFNNLDPDALLKKIRKFCEKAGAEITDELEGSILTILDEAESAANDKDMWLGLIGTILELLAEAQNASYTGKNLDPKNPQVRIISIESLDSPGDIRYFTPRESRELLATGTPVFTANSRVAIESPPLPLPFYGEFRVQMLATAGGSHGNNGLALTSVEVRAKPSWKVGAGTIIKKYDQSGLSDARVKELDKLFYVSLEIPFAMEFSGVEDGSRSSIFLRAWNMKFNDTELTTSLVIKPKLALNRGYIINDNLMVQLIYSPIRGELGYSWEGAFKKPSAPVYTLSGQLEFGAKITDYVTIRHRERVNMIRWSEARLWKPEYRENSEEPFNLDFNFLNESKIVDADSARKRIRFVNDSVTYDPIPLAEDNLVMASASSIDHSKGTMLASYINASNIAELEGSDEFWPSFGALGSAIQTEVAIRSATRGGYWHTRSDENVRGKTFYEGQAKDLGNNERFTMLEWSMAHGASLVVFKSKRKNKYVYPRDAGNGHELRAGEKNAFGNGGRAVFMKIESDEYPGTYYLRSYHHDSEYGFSYLTQVQNEECKLVCIPNLTDPADPETQRYEIIDLNSSF